MLEDVWEVVPLNMANGNAAIVLGLMGVTGEDLWGGLVEGAALADWRRRIMQLRNRPQEVAAVARPYHEEGGERQATVDAGGQARIGRTALVITCELAQQDIMERLDRLDHLLMQAQQLGTGLTWC